ncbi:hypothetical protein [Blautia marasmi]|uniref:hypothetical protein n=1 Tax=Blautia marasmi TaxID=1917868 RepID=UPI000CF1E372|nr:hypothetical protein [Blautia marasmi]
MDYEYELSEQLFLDIWSNYDCPSEISDKNLINEFLCKIVAKSKGKVILDHYSGINFDDIKAIETDNLFTKILWIDMNDTRKRYLDKTINDDEFMIWQIFGCYSYEYVYMDIAKIKFVRNKDHLFMLLQSTLTNPRKLEKQLLKNNTLISKEINTEKLYTEYIFFEGDGKDLIKHSGIVGNLPYYSCIIQPKEHCTPSSVDAKLIMLRETLLEIKERLDNTYSKLINVSETDTDELFAKGNTIRRIMEFSLKHYCVWKEISIEIEQKYGHINLGELKKKVKNFFEIPQNIIDTANELSHDSGQSFSKTDVLNFFESVSNLVENITSEISSDPHRFSEDQI